MIEIVLQMLAAAVRRAGALKLPRLWIPGCPHRPTPKQWLALSLPKIREMLYGGAAGGGKSDFLVMAALQYIDIPGYSAIIFRRTFTQLAAPEDGLMARAMAWLAPHPDFTGSNPVSGIYTRWKFRGGGTLSFSHMQHEKDKYDHQGPSYQFIGWDELTQFSESQYRYLLGRLRMLEGFPAPLRVRAASNPGGSGHDWVKERFPVPDHGVRRPIPNRCFVPAKLSDNPHLDREDYAKQLAELHPFERQQLLDGDWDARPPGSRFKREWFEIVPEGPKPSSRRLRYWDLAATEPKAGADPDWTVGTLWDENEGDYFICDVVRFRGSPQDVDARLKATAGADGVETAIWIEQEGGASGKIAATHLRRLLAGYDVNFDRPTGDKVVRSNPMASASEGGLIKLVAGPWVPAWLTEAEMFPGGSHDDQIDSADGGYGKIALPTGTSWADLYPDTEDETEEAVP